MPPIVTLSVNPAIDESAAVDYVISESKLRCRVLDLEPGGGGINVARALRRLGAEAVTVYPAGGPWGDQLARMLEREGVSSVVIPIADWTRRNLNVTEEATGRQYRFVFPGPTLHQEEWQKCLDAVEKVISRPRFLVASGSLPPGAPRDFYAKVAGLARKIGARLLLDTSGEPLSLALREGVYLIKPSLREFQELTGEKAQDEPRLAECARRLIQEGRCEVIVLSLAAGGALWVTETERGRLGAPAVPVKSSVGAGDAMVAGIVWSLARGWPLCEAVRYGVAAGAAAVMNPGTQLCRREDVETLYEEMRLVPAS